MNRIRILSFVLLVGGIILALLFHILSPSLSASFPRFVAKPLAGAIASSAPPQYRLESLPQADVHLVTLPPDRIAPAISDSLETVEEFAERESAIAVLNAGFFDPQNQKSTSFVTLNGVQVADPRQNERLMENPDLLPYLDRILNRTEFRRYRCIQLERFDLARHLDPVPANCEIVDAIGGGPQLLPELTLEQEGFFDAQSGRDPLGSGQRNARTAIGLTRDGQMIWVMVAQKSDASANGMSLVELADYMKGLGVEKAMNLDGGSSSSLYWDGKAFYGKGDGQGRWVLRSVKSVLLLK
jgi:Phosphodiester glycosidase